MAKKEDSEPKDESFRQWCVLELMGHHKFAGLVSEEMRFGVVMCRIDIPKGKGFVTHYYGGGSIYGCHPVAEAVARAYAKAHEDADAPVSRYELPQLPASASSRVVEDDGLDP